MTVGLKSWLLQLATTSMVGTGVETFILTYTSERGLFQFRSLQLTYRYKYEDQSKLSTNLGQSFTCQVGYRPPCKTQNMVGFFLGGKTLDNMDEVRRMFSTFWTRYDKTHPGSMPALPETTIPILIHGDEGRSLCKRPVMIVSFQCIIPWCGENVKNSSQMLAYVSLKHFVIFKSCLVKIFSLSQD